MTYNQVVTVSRIVRIILYFLMAIFAVYITIDAIINHHNVFLLQVYIFTSISMFIWVAQVIDKFRPDTKEAS